MAAEGDARGQVLSALPGDWLLNTLRAESLHVFLLSCLGLLTKVRPLPPPLACAPVPVEWLELLMDTSGQMGPFQGRWPCGDLRGTAQLGCQGRGRWVPWWDVGIALPAVSVSVC